MRIDLLQKCHTNTMLRLVRGMVAEGKYASQGCDDARIVEMVNEYIADNLKTKACFVAAASDGEIVGFFATELVPYAFRRGYYAAELGLYVLPSWRGSTAAVRLITRMHEWVEESGADAFVVGITSPHNTALAEGVYKRVGFEPWGTLMRKEI